MSHISLDELMIVWKGKLTGLTTSYAEVSIDTGLSMERGVLALIHRVDFIMFPGATTGIVEVHLSRDSKSAILAPDDDDVIAYQRVKSQVITSGIGFYFTPQSQLFIPPVAYAKAKIYFAAKPDVTPSPDTAYVRVYYNLVKVTEKDFFKVATALVL